MLDSNGYLKVIDFGIAKSDVQTDLTSPGLIKGNPGYMAPDVFNQADPDHRIDIYALGLCLYEMATQTRAFKFNSSVSLAQIVSEINKRELPFPSQLQPDLPIGVDDIVLKAIEKDRTKRYQSIDAFSEDLKKITDNRVMSGGEVKKWFTTLFAQRLRERRVFGGQMLDLARKTDAAKSGVLSFPSRMPSTTFSLNSMTASGMHRMAPQTTHVSQLIIDRSHIYKIIGAMFLFFTVSATILYFAAFRDRTDQEDVVLTDNLVISSTPAGATLTVDGRLMAVLGKESLSLRVEPNEEHHLVISKDGYRNFVLRFVGSPVGTKRIDASLIKEEMASEKNNSEGLAAETISNGKATMAPASDKADETAASQEQRRPRRSYFRRASGKRKDNRDEEASSKASQSPADAPLKIENARKIPLPDDDNQDRRKVPIVDEDRIGNLL
jgi:hypothetical protein